MSKNIGILFLAVAVTVMGAGRAHGVSTVGALQPAGLVTLSADAPDDNLAGRERPFVACADADWSATLVGRLPDEFFNVDTNRLDALSFSFAFEADAEPAASLVLYALTTNYEPAAATWNRRNADTAWRAPGGDANVKFGATAVVERATFDVPGATADVYVANFDLMPLFCRKTQGPPFRTNGFLVAFASGGSQASANARIDLLGDAPGIPGEAHPAIRSIWCDPFLNFRDYAISGISNGPFHKEYATNATDETVWWEQDITTVGRVMLNETNGFESRAILSMPKSLMPIDPDRIQSVEAHFQCFNNTWHGEDLVLRPVTSPTRLEMAGNRPLNGANPDHGPSWRWADGPVDTVDTDYPRLAWVTPGGDVSPKYAAHALLNNPNGTFVQNISFDLTPLWRNPEARKLLSDNGAIVYADRATWSGEAWVAVQIYCSDDFTVFNKSANSSFRVTLYPPFAPPDGSPAVAFALLSEAAPEECAPVLPDAPLPSVSGAPGAETRLAVRFHPSLFDQDPRQVDGIRLFLPLDVAPDPDVLSRLVLQPLAMPFDPDAASWLEADADAPWAAPGGDVLPDALPAVLSEYGTGVYFDLAPLLADPAAADALRANGALLRLLPDAARVRDAEEIPPAVAFSASEAPLPLFLAAPLSLRNPAFTADTLSLDAFGLAPGFSYALDSSPSLTAPDWSPVVSPLSTDTPVLPFAPTSPASFYRLRRLP